MNPAQQVMAWILIAVLRLMQGPEPALPEPMMRLAFKQVLVGQCQGWAPLNRGNGARFASSLATIEEVASGLQIGLKGPTPVVVLVPTLELGCYVWEADLDNNGKKDLLISSWTQANGPGADLVLLLQDEAGRFLPWIVPDLSYLDFNENGVRNVVDLNSDGKAELLYLHAERSRTGGIASEVQLYEISELGLSRRTGEFEGWRFPYRGQQQTNALDELNLSTATVFTQQLSEHGLTVTKVQARSDCGAGIQPFTVANGRISQSSACVDSVGLSNGVTMDWPIMMVLDSVDRRIALGPGAIHDLLEEARTRKLRVRYACMRGTDALCRPSMFWATQ